MIFITLESSYAWWCSFLNARTDPEKKLERGGRKRLRRFSTFCISLHFNPLDHDLLRGVVEEVKYHVTNCVCLYVLGLMDRDDKSLNKVFNISI